MHTILRLTSAIIVLFSILSIMPAQAVRAQAVEIPEGLTARADGTFRVLVQLRGDYGDEAVLPRDAIDGRRAAIARDQSLVIDALAANARASRRFVSIPAFAVTVDMAGLQALQTNPLVAKIEIDRVNKPSMVESNELIGSTAAIQAGYGGAGMVVAVLDTGVQHRDQATGELRPHAMLDGRVSAEACFSTHDPSNNIESLCKDNAASQTFEDGAAAPCADLCDHGTHVAGTVAGNRVNIWDPYAKVNRPHSGVAPQAKIIAVQVFSKYTSEDDCGVGSAPCVSAFYSDIIAALDWLYDNYGDARFGGTLVAANMSLGGGYYDTLAACDRDLSVVKTAIDNLRSRKVATVIASGNEAYIDAVAAPACISSAVAVGATLTANATNGITDRVATFSNSPTVANNAANTSGDRLLDLLAPGELVTSAIPTGSTTTAVTSAYDSWPGTSMATPHVAGAWAAMRSAAPTASVTQVLNWLRNTGKAVTNRRNNLVVPRIDVGKAVTAARNAGKTTTISSYAVEFGKVGRGQSANRVITINNIGTTQVPLAISISGAQFSRSQTCTTALAAKSKCTITVRYSPTTNTHMLQQRGTLTVTINRVAHNIGLSGTTVLYDLTPREHDFGNVRMNTNKLLSSVKVINYSRNTIQFASYGYEWDRYTPQPIDNFSPDYITGAQYPRWDQRIKNWPSTIAAGTNKLVLQDLLFRPTYSRFPAGATSEPIGDYGCYLRFDGGDGNVYTYGHCAERPALIYFILDVNLTDGISCATSPNDASCVRLKFPFTGVGIN